MKTYRLLLIVLLLTAAGCTRKEPPPDDKPRPGPGQIGGTEPGTPLETAETPDPSDPSEPLVPSPYPQEESSTASGAGVTRDAGDTPKKEGYFLSFRAVRSDNGSEDAYSFRAQHNDHLSCTFDDDFSTVQIVGRASGHSKEQTTRKIDFSIGGFDRGQMTYVHPWRTFVPKKWRNTPDGKGTPFAVEFLYALPRAGGYVKGTTRTIPDAGHENPYANEQCSTCTISVRINDMAQTVRGKFECQRLWTYPDISLPPGTDQGPVSITGEFYLPYAQN